MIESVVGLLMFVNGEIKEHVCKKSMAIVYAASVKLKELFQNQYLTNAGRVKQN